MAKILCVLYPDPQAGYPPNYARNDIPAITTYTNGQTAPTPKGPLGFKPSELVGSVSGELGLRSYLEKLGHELIVTSDKDGPNSEFEKFLPDAEVVISQPFWSAYLTKGRIARAKKLKLALTAGTLEILQSCFGGTPIREEYLIVDGGKLAGTGAKSYELT